MAQNIEEAKQAVRAFLEESKIPPKALQQVGNMAEQAIKDKALYPMLRQQLIANKLFAEDDIPENFDYTILATLAAMGRLLPQMGVM